MLHHFIKNIAGRCGSWVVISVLGVGLAGCAFGSSVMGKPVQSKAAAYEPMDQAAIQPTSATTPEVQSEGSLWREDAHLIYLFADQKARTVGDIVTIKIDESSDATNKASTATDRSSSLSASMDAFFNAEKRYPADQPFFNPFAKVAGSLESDFSGAGTTKRSGDLNAYITALVTKVLPNGNLVVTGSREVLINNENQVIELTGVVRPRDISANNQVLSTYVANARISYSGTGVVNARQKPGWLTNIIMTVWPF
jgi:flagellar L-ring protein precursor FlgH